MMPHRMSRAAPALLAALALAAGCTRDDSAAKHRLFARDDLPAPALAFDPLHPERALALSADEVAGRLGSFDWSAAVAWSVTGPEGTAPIHVTEQHRVRQSSTGEFEVRADVDPDQGPAATTGKQVVFAGGTTYARSLPSPFRARPTDHGRDARRFREDSFGLARSLSGLLGPALRLDAAGDETVLGREARRYRIALATDARLPAPAKPPAGAQADPDTQRRQGFLQGRVPTAADGELLVDAATGVPLRVRLAASFAAPGPKAPTVTVELSAQVKALGGEVAAVSAPAEALPDERKPAGPASALETAGLKKRGEDAGSSADPADEGD
jgi:hypothetical protein